ncbi:hypothetical protein VPH35_089375 [Triticum aestivum]
MIMAWSPVLEGHGAMPCQRGKSPLTSMAPNNDERQRREDGEHTAAAEGSSSNKPLSSSRPPRRHPASSPPVDVDHPPRPSLPFSSSCPRLRRRRPQPRRPLPPTCAGRHPELRGEERQISPPLVTSLPPSSDGRTR